MDSAVLNQQPSEAVMSDVVLYTSSILEIDELEVFTRAHRAWFGTDNKRFVTACYNLYFNKGDLGPIPCWVRHFCRKEITKFLKKEKEGDPFGLFIKWCIAKVRHLRTIGTAP